MNLTLVDRLRQRPKPSKTGPPMLIPISAFTFATTNAFMRRALAISTTVLLVTSSLSFVPELSIDEDTSRGYGRIGKEVNAANDTINGAFSAKSLRFRRQKQKRSLSTHKWDHQPKTKTNLEDRRGFCLNEEHKIG